MAERTSYKFIVDASVLIKWFISEPEDRVQSQKLLIDFKNKKTRILTPSLMTWELGNKLGRTFHKERAMEAFSFYKMLRLPEALLSLDTSFLAFEIMKKCPSVSFYDASYHAMALHVKGIFLTADKKYYDKAKFLGNIQLLKDYQ